MPQDVSADRSRLQDNNLVLVVDDDPGMLKGVQRLLRQHAYETWRSRPRRRSKNHVDFEKAVCIILDINLPDGSGIELRQDLKAAGISVPATYITGNENPVRKTAPASGCLACLTKPFSAQELVGALDQGQKHRRSVG
jgi:FixJ family two-component response regulator